VQALLVHHGLHAFLAYSLPVKDLEHLLEVVFLAVISEEDEDHGLGTLAFSESGQVHEGALGELADGDVSEPDVEALVFLVQETGEAGVDLGSVQTNSGVEFEHVLSAVLHVEESAQFVARAFGIVVLSGDGIVGGAIGSSNR